MKSYEEYKKELNEEQMKRKIKSEEMDDVTLYKPKPMNEE